MGRRYVLAGIAAVAGGLSGCSSTWEVVSSRDFKSDPFGRMFKSEDPLHTLRTNPEGAARAAAMTRLTEPIRNGGSQADQDEVVEQILGPAAATDPSPVVRAAAIDALGRFKDPRAANLLIAAYAAAGPKPKDPPAADPPAALRLTGAGDKPDAPARLKPRFDLSGPSGYPAETVAMLRSKAVDGLTHSGRPEAVQFLTHVALADGPAAGADRDTRLAAVRGLGALKAPEAAPALAKVLAAESANDVAIAGRAHAGLVEITGRDLPADPDQWNAVVQAGGVAAPGAAPPGQPAPAPAIQRVIGTSAQ